MGSSSSSCCYLLFLFIVGASTLCTSHHTHIGTTQTATLQVNASESAGMKIPDTLFGIFFEEINHAGSGGLWAELVNNTGFEAQGRHAPVYLFPWNVIGNDSTIIVSSDLSSCFENNKVAVRLDVLCDDAKGTTACPSGGVGIYNPGFWGMNIEQGKTYKGSLYSRALDAVNISVSLTSSTGQDVLATSSIIIDSSTAKNWTKREFTLEAKASNTNSRLQLTANKKVTIWFDQVSVMPTDNYKGHGFRADLMELLMKLKPRFLRFPGGCFVEGVNLRNAFRWKETVGPWEERSGHYGDNWDYWTDDKLGYYEFLVLAEDLGAAPVWVINNGVSHRESVPPAYITPFVQEMLDSIEFARGNSSSTWGSVRAAMGHPEPFDLKYVAIGNEDCGKQYYKENYLKFYEALRREYPDIKAISNCDGSSKALDHPADYYDFHTYPSSGEDMLLLIHAFDNAPRKGPKAFVSEYAVVKEAGNGNLLAALSEAAFLMGLEKNSDLVEMASYAPLFVNTNDRRWSPDAIVFDSSRSYGTPSYWMQHFFTQSSGATFLPSSLKSNSSYSIVASAISWENPEDKKNYITIKVVNYGSDYVNLKVSVDGLESSAHLKGSRQTVLTSSDLTDENTFDNPKKVVPVSSSFDLMGSELDISLKPHSLTSFDLLKTSSYIKIEGDDSMPKSID